MARIEVERPVKKLPVQPAGIVKWIQGHPMHQEVTHSILVREHAWVVRTILSRGNSGGNLTMFLNIALSSSLSSFLSLKNINKNLNLKKEATSVIKKLVAVEVEWFDNSGGGKKYSYYGYILRIIPRIFLWNEWRYVKNQDVALATLAWWIEHWLVY